jgi:hypothetical protein
MRLIDAIRDIAKSLGTPAAKPATTGAAFFEQGEVVSVDGLGALTVRCSAGTVSAKPVTDEPFRASMKVWISQSSDGYIVHGGVR